MRSKGCTVQPSATDSFILCCTTQPFFNLTMTPNTVIHLPSINHPFSIFLPQLFCSNGNILILVRIGVVLSLAPLTLRSPPNTLSAMTASHWRDALNADTCITKIQVTLQVRSSKTGISTQISRYRIVGLPPEVFSATTLICVARSTQHYAKIPYRESCFYHYFFLALWFPSSCHFEIDWRLLECIFHFVMDYPIFTGFPRNSSGSFFLFHRCSHGCWYISIDPCVVIQTTVSIFQHQQLRQNICGHPRSVSTLTPCNYILLLSRKLYK